MKVSKLLTVFYFISNVLLRTISPTLFASVRIVIYILSSVSLHLIRRFIKSGPSVRQTVIHGIAIGVSYVYQVNLNQSVQTDEF